MAGKQRLQQKVEQTEEERAALEAFNKITEAASALMDSGELDVYSGVREEFLRAAALFAPAADIFGDDDMFGDDEPKSKVRKTGHLPALDSPLFFTKGLIALFCLAIVNAVLHSCALGPSLVVCLICVARTFLRVCSGTSNVPIYHVTAPALTYPGLMFSRLGHLLLALKASQKPHSLPQPRAQAPQRSRLHRSPYQTLQMPLHWLMIDWCDPERCHVAVMPASWHRALQ